MHYTVLHTSSIVVKRLSLTIGGDTVKRNKMLFRVEDKSNATFDGSDYVLHQQKHRGYCFVQKTVVSLLSHSSSHISVDDSRGKPGDSFDVF